MIDMYRFIEGLSAINDAAHAADTRTERHGWFRLKSQMISTAIELLPLNMVWLKYELNESGDRVSVLCTFLFPISRAFHAPFHTLSGVAQIIVVRRLGNPYVFKRLPEEVRLGGRVALVAGSEPLRTHERIRRF